MLDKRKYDKIFLGFDSTILTCESMDLLSEHKGILREIQQYRQDSLMSGKSIEEIHLKIVDTLRPSLQDIQSLIPPCVEALSDEIVDIISAIRSLDKKVYVLSSNFHSIVDPIANVLGIPFDRVVANDIYFNAKGFYQSVNATSPLCMPGGKAVLLRSLMKPGDRVAFIGDIQSDWAAYGVADTFIAFENTLHGSLPADYIIQRKNIFKMVDIIFHPAEKNILLKKGFSHLFHLTYTA